MGNYYSVQQFSDADEHAQSLVETDQSYFQIESGPFQSTLRQFDLDGLHLFAECSNRRVVQCGQISAGSIGLAWTTLAGAAPTSRGREIDELSIMVARSGEDWVLHVPPGTEIVGVTMSADEFDRLAESLGLTTLQYGLRHSQFTPGSNRSTYALSALRSRIDVLKSNAASLADAGPRAMARKQLLDDLFCTLSESSSSSRFDVTRLTYSDIVKRSQEIALGNAEYPTSVLDLCSELRICRRTLQKSFLQVTGQSPSSYLRAVRLCGVRRLLRSTLANQMTIANAAARWGFFHLGNFASDYRRLFGELPSRTPRFAS
ncbi:helix-turn-helix domain-containing protein [Paraburkholderia agricolaris]|uniref:Helix-turn-helix domain-containing protein n=1 Tax=Paraburkholderia agricolaris TaxID=2152888 RepID=A0ABW8ZU02_9BURK